MNRTGNSQIDPRKLAGYAFVAAMVIAPFLASVYGWSAGLAVMVIALAATTYLAAGTLRSTATPQHLRLKLLVTINAGLCLLCLVALIARIMSERL